VRDSAGSSHLGPCFDRVSGARAAEAERVRRFCRVCRVPHCESLHVAGAAPTPFSWPSSASLTGRWPRRRPRP